MRGVMITFGNVHGGWSCGMGKIVVSIQCRTGKPTFALGALQRLLLKQRAARRVQDAGRGSPRSLLSLAHDSLIDRGQRHREDQAVHAVLKCILAFHGKYAVRIAPSPQDKLLHA